eukprot:TRINITY_DN1211_c0_g3_i9.p1 TRINITY_DN1211_c0_g3~~TRINITY_DN1211_c0_g3_i9.p1  ORF type:complete len:252 (+),score=47.58 TRINITY_DN1211_c0_g3_i9:215-970(+)
MARKQNAFSGELTLRSRTISPFNSRRNPAETVRENDNDEVKPNGKAESRPHSRNDREQLQPSRTQLTQSSFQNSSLLDKSGKLMNDLLMENEIKNREKQSLIANNKDLRQKISHFKIALEKHKYIKASLEYDQLEANDQLKRIDKKSNDCQRLEQRLEEESKRTKHELEKVQEANARLNELIQNEVTLINTLKNQLETLRKDIKETELTKEELRKELTLSTRQEERFKDELERSCRARDNLVLTIKETIKE